MKMIEKMMEQMGGGAEGGGGREGRDEDGVERSAHRVPDPVRQRSGLVLGPQLVYALVEGVHEHKHIVGADAHHHEDDEEEARVSECRSPGRGLLSSRMYRQCYIINKAGSSAASPSRHHRSRT